MTLQDLWPLNAPCALRPAAQAPQDEQGVLLVVKRQSSLAALAPLLRAVLDVELLAITGPEQAMLQAKSPSLRSLLIEMDPGDGAAVHMIQRLRRDGVQTPILVLARSTEVQDEVRALEAGASDFVRLPCARAVLLARIRAQVRQHEASEHAELRIGPYLFRPATRELLDPARRSPIRLTRTETALLRYLYRQNGRSVSQYDLLTEVWGYSRRVRSHTVQTHVYRLRRKIEADPANPLLIVTKDDGYLLVRTGARPL